MSKHSERRGVPAPPPCRVSLHGGEGARSGLPPLPRVDGHRGEIDLSPEQLRRGREVEAVVLREQGRGAL